MLENVRHCNNRKQREHWLENKLSEDAWEGYQQKECHVPECHDTMNEVLRDQVDILEYSGNWITPDGGCGYQV